MELGTLDALLVASLCRQALDRSLWLSLRALRAAKSVKERDKHLRMQKARGHHALTKLKP